SVSADFTLSGGTFTAGTGTVSFGGGAATLNVTTADTLRNVTIAAGAKTIAAGTTVTATGTVSLDGGSLAGTGTLAAQGNISQASAFGNGTATLLVNGGGAQTRPRVRSRHRGRAPDRDGCRAARGGRPAGPRHQQARGHAHPGRHDPDDPQL